MPQLARARASVQRELARVQRVALGRRACRRGEGRHRRGLLDDDDPGCLGGLVHGGIALASADDPAAVLRKAATIKDNRNKFY
jgi:hypothetical protein